MLNDDKSNQKKIKLKKIIKEHKWHSETMSLSTTTYLGTGWLERVQITKRGLFLSSPQGEAGTPS